MVHEFDIFHGGTKQLIKYLEQRKKATQRAPVNLVNQMTKVAMSNIQREGQKIINNYQMYSAVMNDNIVVTLGVSHNVIKNTSEHATYSEFGTGIVGSRQSYPKGELAWQYDVNSHGEKGWVYKVGDDYARTKGEPSNPTYYRASQSLRRRMPTFIKNEMKKVTK